MNTEQDKQVAPDVTTDIGGLRLRNPILTASGTFGYGEEFAPLIDLNRLGAIIVKGLSLMPSAGNKPPRIVETACGMLNAIGLENIGIEAFIRDKLPFLRKLAPPVIANIYGKTIDEYVALAERIDAEDDIRAIEVNISCPNVKAGGVAFGVNPKSVHEVVSAVRKKTGKPLLIKLSPNVSDIVEIARSAEDGGANGLSLINTITGMAIDVRTRKPKLANITGGLSGPAIKPVALRMVWQAVSAVKIPVVGIGGIVTAMDALEFFIAGAAAVQIGTANFMNPAATMEILDGITGYLQEQGIPRLADLVGTLSV
ncbi:MAG: dihydroorotate dehydrogenase [Thermodesulfobacteriota bacterium]